LAHGGEAAPLRYRDDDPAPRGTALFGATAAWYVTDILENAPAPPGMLPGEVRRGRRLAVKTGTSYGFRDAWAIGYDSEVTIAVWAGRPDGTPMPGHSGRVTAAPVLFKIADLLGLAAAPSSSSPPGIVSRRDLPRGLRRLSSGPLQIASGPKILYPPDGATVAWDGGELPLEAAGGQGPLRWLIDGRPLASAMPRRELYWRPTDIGFAQLTVIDASGHSARATIRLVR
jgi:penicillin-binding protein 1C